MKQIKLKKEFIQFIKFGIVGFINTMIHYAIVNVGYYALGWHEQLCNFIAFVITIFSSYMLNGSFVFKKEKEKRNFWKSLAKCYMAYSLTTLGLNALLLFIEEQQLGIPHYIATFMNLVVTVPLNYLLNKFWIYKIKDN